MLNEEEKRITPPKRLVQSQGQPFVNGEDQPFVKERAKMSFREDHWHFCVRVGLLLATAILTLLTVFTFVYHLIAPSGWHWLGSQELTRLKDIAGNIIVGLLMSSATAYYFKRK